MNEQAPVPSRKFSQRKTVVNGLQIITASDELFNHVDDNLPMWSEDGDRVVRLDISFARAFSEVPCVTLGLTGIDAAHDQDLRFWLHALNVEREGFTVEFTTWDDTHIARASVSWQALGKRQARYCRGRKSDQSLIS